MDGIAVTNLLYTRVESLDKKLTGCIRGVASLGDGTWSFLVELDDGLLIQIRSNNERIMRVLP